MKASDARKIVSDKEAADVKKREFDSKQREINEEKYKELAAKDYKVQLKEIYKLIKEESAKGRRECRYYESYNNAEYGGVYMREMASRIEKALKREGYKLEVLEVRDNYGAIYEGYMNPEYVGSEYSSTSMIIEIKW